jgi:hypothetical protein
MHQQRHGLAVFHHEAQALFSIGRIQWHISATGFEDGEKADDHLQAALDSDGHAVIRFDAQLDQVT